LHVSRGDAAAKIWLQPVRVEYAQGFNPAEMRRLREITNEHEAFPRAME
jgi:hypothetical protein